MSEKIKTYTWQESYDMCRPFSCKWCTFDMDMEAYCQHDKSFELVPGYGASRGLMSRSGLCTGFSDDENKNLRQLFEKYERK